MKSMATGKILAAKAENGAESVGSGPEYWLRAERLPGNQAFAFPPAGR
jgi:hypothetical protein